MSARLLDVFGLTVAAVSRTFGSLCMPRVEFLRRLAVAARWHRGPLSF
jgi:hypothetical protein